jgi:hypothetical protein
MPQWARETAGSSSSAAIWAGSEAGGRSGRDGVGAGELGSDGLGSDGPGTPGVACEYGWTGGWVDGGVASPAGGFWAV